MVISLTQTSLRQLYKVWYDFQRRHLDLRWARCSWYCFSHSGVDLRHASSHTWFISWESPINISVGVDFIVSTHIVQLIYNSGLRIFWRLTANLASIVLSSIIWTPIGAPKLWSWAKTRFLSWTAIVLPICEVGGEIVWPWVSHPGVTPRLVLIRSSGFVGVFIGYMIMKTVTYCKFSVVGGYVWWIVFHKNYDIKHYRLEMFYGIKHIQQNIKVKKGLILTLQVYGWAE